MLGRYDYTGIPTPKPPTSSLGVKAKLTTLKPVKPTKIAVVKPKLKKVSTPQPTPPPPEENKAVDIS